MEILQSLDIFNDGHELYYKYYFDQSSTPISYPLVPPCPFKFYVSFKQAKNTRSTINASMGVRPSAAA